MPDLHPVTIPLTLTFNGTMHLGTGRAEGLLNRTVRRSADGRPYVPGSALKGALRMTAERFVQQLNVANTLDPVVQLGRRRRGDTILDTPCQAPRPEEMCQSRTPCIVCRVFGNVFTGTRLLVDDAYPGSGALRDSMSTLLDLQNDEKTREGEGPSDPRASAVDVLTRLSVDRRRKGAKKGALFTSEYSRPESGFRATVSGALPWTTLDDVDKVSAEMVLLAAAIAATDQVGGEATTGHGQCTIRPRGDTTLQLPGHTESTSIEKDRFADTFLSEEALESLSLIGWQDVM
jgi:CRISPR/Cas system CSM-associated protein Csm3 (group 7 of RAMP superfamily)